MKTRYCFVSNSSSSSFIVAFERKPKSVNELKCLLFGENEYYDNPYYWPGDDRSSRSWETSYIANIVWDDMQELESIEHDGIVSYMTGWIGDNEPEYPSVWRKSRSEIQELMDEYHSQLDDYRQKVADDFLKRVGEHCLLYCFSYSDENGQLYSAMEHGGLFERLPHITISHH